MENQSTTTIHQSIIELNRKKQEALLRKDYMQVVCIGGQINDMEEKLNAIRKEDNKLSEFEQKLSVQDRTLRSFAGKVLALTISDSDLAVIHLDMYMTYFKEMGYTQREEWKRVQDNLRRAIDDFRRYNISMFDKSTASQTCDLTNDMERAIRKADLFTDREMQHYCRYFDLAAK